MKTTLEMPDFLFRRAKSVAAARGIPFAAIRGRGGTREVRDYVERQALNETRRQAQHLHGEKANREKLPKEKANLISQTGLYLMPAITYSPTHFRVQYHRPSGA